MHIWERKASSNFEATALAVDGAWLIAPLRRVDDRGHFMRTFCRDEFAELGLETSFVQHSLSFNGSRLTLRGLHMQQGECAETKLVRCTRGAIFDVVVDLRPKSRTFRRYASASLTPERADALYIPPGCAHGFLTLEDASEVFYEITPSHRADAGAGLRWDDPEIAVAWPHRPLVLSERDRALPTFEAYFSGVRAASASRIHHGPADVRFE